MVDATIYLDFRFQNM